jgi:hypothetical protein
MKLALGLFEKDSWKNFDILLAMANSKVYEKIWRVFRYCSCQRRRWLNPNKGSDDSPRGPQISSLSVGFVSLISFLALSTLMTDVTTFLGGNDKCRGNWKNDFGLQIYRCRGQQTSLLLISPCC